YQTNGLVLRSCKIVNLGGVHTSWGVCTDVRDVAHLGGCAANDHFVLLGNRLWDGQAGSQEFEFGCSCVAKAVVDCTGGFIVASRSGLSLQGVVWSAGLRCQGNERIASWSNVAVLEGIVLITYRIGERIKPCIDEAEAELFCARVA